MTNTSAIASIDRLRGLDRSLNTTENRISSGLRVGSASDNAAYWSITTTMRSDDKALAAVKDAIALGAASADTAYIGMNQAIDVMSEYKAKLIAAREPGLDRDKINAELTELREQMRTIAEGASFNGENWLVTQNGNTETDRKLVGSFIRGEDGQVRVGEITYSKGSAGTPNRLIDETGPGTFGILTQPGLASGWDTHMSGYVFMTGKDAWPSARLMEVDNSTSNEDIDIMISGTEYMMQLMTDAAADLGAISSRLELQTEFVQDIRDASNRGVGKLRDAELNLESTRLKAMQTQQQLSIQALSIANSNGDNLLSLYR
ncbi:flagellin N-terminal helical domain-containing protein [Rhizobium alvei]|uniref:flagellin N-terminal helical domain-containing protein n=1 Tax=Rhizobium alvei TaxID=1132659 RepID=UPI0033909D9C